MSLVIRLITIAIFIFGIYTSAPAAYSRVYHTATAGQTSFVVDFADGVIDQGSAEDAVTVYVNDVLNSSITVTWTSPTTLEISGYTPAESDEIQFRRITPKDELFVDFTAGTSIRTTTLDLNLRQLLHATQEAIDVTENLTDASDDAASAAASAASAAISAAAVNYHKVESLADLRAYNSVATAIFLTGRVTESDGGQGVFIWDASDLSTQVTNDPLYGVYVAPNSDLTGASGAWVRQYTYISPQMFGAIGDGATDDTSSVQAAVNFAYANPTNPIDIEISGLHKLTSEITITSSLSIGLARDKFFTIFGKGSKAGFYTELPITMFGSADDYSTQAQERQVMFKNIGFEVDVNTTNAYVTKGAFIQLLFDQCTFKKIKANSSTNNCFSIWFTRCYMADWSGIFFFLTGASGTANDISFIGCYANGGDQFIDVGLTQEFRLIDCTIESCTGIPVTTRGARGCLITGNYLEGNALSTGSYYIDLNTTGSAELSGVFISGNHFFCTNAQLADASFYAVKMQGANGVVSMANWCYGQFYDSTSESAFGFNSFGDLEGVTGAPALPQQLVRTVNLRDVRTEHLSVGNRTFEDYEDLIVGTEQAFLNVDAENQLDYEIGRIGSRIRVTGTTATSSFANIRFITDAVSWFKGAMVFETNNVDGTGTAPTERMRILANGNVGIGTPTPGSKLSVVGLPTSSAGLTSGDIWNNSGVLNIVP